MFLIGLHICIYILQVTLDLDNETSDEMAMLTLFCPDPHSSSLIIKRATLYRSNYHCPSAWHHTDWHSCWPRNSRWWDPDRPAGSWCSSCAPSDCLWRSPDHSTAGCWPCWRLCWIRRRTTLRYTWCDPRCWFHSDWLDWCVYVSSSLHRNARNW